MTHQYPVLTLHIGGAWREGSDTGRVVLNPATGDILSALPGATTADIDDALEAAERSFVAWRSTSAVERSKILRGAADHLRARATTIATTLTMEQGKTIAEATAEVMAAAEVFEWFAEEGRRSYGRIVPARLPGIRHLVVKEPIGPVALFTPWNFPAVIPARKIAAALAAGCTCVIKPAEETPATCLELARALQDAGLPAGVLNVVFGEPAAISTQLIGSAIIRKISFTGSIPVGRHLAALAAAGAKPATLELGGHAPVLVFDDADIELAARLSATFKFRNAGQVCTSPTRFLVQDSVHDEFVRLMSAAADKTMIGNGLTPGMEMGPVANGRRLTAMEEFTSDALRRGARKAAGGEHGGERGGKGGFFWRPTVIADVPAEARIMRDEPFGPIAATARFSTFDEAIEIANHLPQGLAAYAFTRSDKRVRDVGAALDAGMVGINNFMINFPETPFGGVKDSGYGSEGGSEGLESYMRVKHISEA